MQIDVADTIRRAPKAELHVHLEGSLSAAFWRRFDPNLGAAISRFARRKCGRFADFLACMERIHRSLATPAHYGAACRDLLGALVADGVRYAEITWAPGGIWEFCGVPPQDVYPEIAAALREYTEYVDARLLVDIIRNQSLKMAMDIVAWLDAERPAYVVGINIGGDEERFPVHGLLPAIEAARNLGLGISIHAGEVVDEDRMLAAVNAARPQRVGHAVALRSVYAEALFINKGIHIEACPSSNRRLGLLASASDHPLLARPGLRGSLNTDDRSFFRSSLTMEIVALIEERTVMLSDVARWQRQATLDAFAHHDCASLRDVAEAWRDEVVPVHA
jgi:adenosine deaminase